MVFLGLLFAATCYFLFYPEPRISLYSILPSQSRFGAKDQAPRDERHTKMSTPIKQAEQKDGRFTDDQIATAMKKVLSEKKTEKPKDDNASKKVVEQKYLYEIELFSGGLISTDNVIITNKTITYKSNKGLVVSLNREEIKTMKKIKLDQ